MAHELNFVNSIHVYEWSQDITDQLETEMNKIEAALMGVLEMLEKSLSNRLQKEILEGEPSSVRNSLLRNTNKIITILKRLTQVGETIVKENDQLRKEIKDQQVLLEEFEMERDVLLQQVHAYLEANSSLRVRLEEQRCQTGAIQRQLNADLETQIKSLEKDKEQLSVLNMEKDKQIHKMTLMLEQATECLKNRETEVLNWKNKKNNLVSMLKADLQEVLGEKSKIEQKYVSLKERLEHCFFKNNEGSEQKKKNLPLKRSLSMGDFNWINFYFLEKNIMLEPSQDTSSSDSHRRQFFKNAAEVKSHQTEGFFPNPWKSHATHSWPNDTMISSPTTKDRLKNPSVHAQLNALRCDLLNVTKKLEALKFHLTSSGVIPVDPKPPETRRLKRKANPVQEKEDASEGIYDEQKFEFKNLKNILQDAKNLNAKLQNLREEKQKMIDLNNRREEEEEEEKVEETEKKNEEFSQTTHEKGPTVGNHNCKTR